MIIGKDRFRIMSRWVWPILSGALLAGAFPPFSETGETAWFALVPLFWRLRRVSPREGFKAGFFSGLTFWVLTLCWFPAIIKNNGPWALVLLGWAGLAAWCALFFGAFGALSARVWTWTRPATPRFACGVLRLTAVLVIDPLLWVGLEWVRGWLFSGFAWNFLGVSQAGNLPIIQVASLAGVYGVSLLVVWGNGALTSLAERMFSPIIRRLRNQPIFPQPFPLRIANSLESFLPFILILAAWGWGGTRVNRWRKEEAKVLDRDERAWRITLIQPNAPCVFEANQELARVRFDGLREQTRLADMTKPDLIVWPETATPGYLPGNEVTLGYVRSCLSEGGASLLTGTVEVERTEVPGVMRVYNAAWLLNAQGERLGRYRKRHLVPFGEYIPFDKAIPILQKLAPTGESCTPGTDPGIITLANPAHSAPLQIGPIICFEDTIPALCRETARAGADLLALMTNDAWFNHSCEPLQHRQQAVFRAVETGLPLVRAANSGISCFISPVGKIRQLENEGCATDFDGFLSLKIPVLPLSPPYLRWGDAILAIPGALLALGLALVRRRRIQTP